MAVNHRFLAHIFRLSVARTKGFYPGYSNLIYDSSGKIVNRPICGPKNKPGAFKKPVTTFYKQTKTPRANPEETPKEDTEEMGVTWRTMEGRDKEDS
ncbi:hypothetical protein FGADI_12171 [Fusarium gaditjirri]|uniref:Uncharacterized protein n=1 Tax=Fusarium gaditjirri TaxID=282569 RepID=A0A8H4STA1_9HYPO|nr:hypothetical protein FGADI_12171 [Fusarium gaditjirri]